MTAYARIQAQLRRRPRRWLLTGAAGFIGSHLLETLLRLGQPVIGVDNFSTGSPLNLERVRAAVGARAWRRFRLLEGSIVEMNLCREAVRGAELVLHQAGFVSVPLSLEDPLGCHQTNVTGTLNLLIAAREAGARRFLFASSCSVYGDDPAHPKQEAHFGRPLSPYSASKQMAEAYLALFAARFGLSTVALRYFNVFGPGQNPTGGYAAVIPHWLRQMFAGEPCEIFGDGTATRDYCHVENIVQANLLAAVAPAARLQHRAYNVGLGQSTNLLQLHAALRGSAEAARPGLLVQPVRHRRARAGDIAHSTASIARIQADLDYGPTLPLVQALQQTAAWFANTTPAPRGLRGGGPLKPSSAISLTPRP